MKECTGHCKKDRQTGGQINNTTGASYMPQLSGCLIPLSASQ